MLLPLTARQLGSVTLGAISRNCWLRLTRPLRRLPVFCNYPRCSVPVRRALAGFQRGFKASASELVAHLHSTGTGTQNGDKGTQSKIELQAGHR